MPVSENGAIIDIVYELKDEDNEKYFNAYSGKKVEYLIFAGEMSSNKTDCFFLLFKNGSASLNAMHKGKKYIFEKFDTMEELETFEIAISSACEYAIGKSI